MSCGIQEKVDECNHPFAKRGRPCRCALRPVPVTVTQGINVAGTVNVKDIDEPGRSPYAELVNLSQVQDVCSTTGGNFQRCLYKGGFIVVPAGKRLVLTHATGYVRAPLGCKLASAELHTSSIGGRAGGSIVIHYLALNPSAAIPELATFGHPITAYVEAGQSVEYQVDASCAGISTFSQVISLAGYFVSVP